MKTTLQSNSKDNSIPTGSLFTQPSPFTSARNTFLQRQCDCGGSSGSKGECDACEKKRLFLNRQSTGRNPQSQLPPIVHDVLRSRGEPLNEEVRNFMEPRYGHDFSQVRIHLGGQAAESARSVDAEAYTVGQHIVFGAGQYTPETMSGRKLLAHELAHTIQQSKGIGYSKEGISEPGDPYEQEADRMAERVVNMPKPSKAYSQDSSKSNSVAQQKETSQEEAPEGETTPVSSAAQGGDQPALDEAQAQEETPAAARPSGLIVEDDVAETGPGQMKKSDFLGQLRSSICASADAILASAGQSTGGCPYIEYWFGYYANRDSASVERAIRRYAPEAAAASSASAYIPIITERVSRAVSIWATTGQVSGVPEELPTSGPTPSAGESNTGSEGKTIGASSKGQCEGATRPQALNSISGKLGPGEALEGAVRSRMESAFGYDFSQVRVHKDEKAASLSSGLEARAFTVGSNIAFGSGEYQPGTLVGDAIIAHELAHVVQQQGADSSKESLPKETSQYPAMEEDADEAAMGAVASLWSGAKGLLANISRNAVPRLRSGLSLQRCSSKKCRIKSGPTYTPSGNLPATSSGGMKTATFNMAAEFEHDPSNDIYASCCETRQHILWTVGPEPQTGAFVPASNFSPNNWYEDRDPAGKRYGHRTGTHAECISINHYENSTGTYDCPGGVKYVGRDTPTGASTRTGEWRFRLKVIDVCDGGKDVGTAASVNVQW